MYAGDISLVDSMVTVKITNAHSCPPRNSPSGRLSCRYTPMCVKQSVYLVVPAVLSVLKRLGIASVTIHRQLAKAGHEMPCGISCGGFLGVLVVKSLPSNARDAGLSPVSKLKSHMSWGNQRKPTHCNKDPVQPKK